MIWLTIPLMGLANFIRGGNILSPGLWLSLPIVMGAAWLSWLDWRIALAWVVGWYWWQCMPWGHWIGLGRWTGADNRPLNWFEKPFPTNDHAALFLRMLIGFVGAGLIVVLGAWIVGGDLPWRVPGFAPFAAFASVCLREIGWQMHERWWPQPQAGGIPYGEALEGLLAWGPFVMFTAWWA